MTGDVRATVTSAPEPGLLRPAIEAALAGRPWPDGPEAEVAQTVLRAVESGRHGAPSDREDVSW